MLTIKQIMRKDTPDLYNIKELQNAILSIAEYIDAFCIENNIAYCLMGGSALGAVRHKGFIPWDDDLDIFMTPDNYENFRKLFLEKGDREKYYLQELGRYKGMVSRAKIRLNGSYFEEEIVKKEKIHQGIFVDIFILHNCPKSIFSQKWQYLWAKYIMMKSLANRNINIPGLIGHLINFMRYFFPKRFLLGFALKQVYKYRDSESDFLCHFLGRARFKKALYKKEYFLKMKKMPFETINLYVPEQVELYLKERWGDYMKLPSLAEINSSKHVSKWNIDFEGDYDTSEEKYYI